MHELSQSPEEVRGISRDYIAAMLTPALRIRALKGADRITETLKIPEMHSAVH